MLAASEDEEREGRDDFLDEKLDQEGGVESDSQRIRENTQPVSLRLVVMKDVDGEENQKAATEVDDASTLHLSQSLDSQEIEDPSPDAFLRGFKSLLPNFLCQFE